MSIPTIDDYLAEPRARTEGDARKSPTGQKILAADPETQIIRLRDALARMAHTEGHPLLHFHPLLALRSLTSAILRRNLPLTEDDIQALLASTAVAADHFFPLQFVPLRPLLSQTERSVYLHGLTPGARAALLKVRDHLTSQVSGAADRRALAQIVALLEPEVEHQAAAAASEDEGLEGPRDAAIVASLLVSGFLHAEPELPPPARDIWMTQLRDHASGIDLSGAPNSVRVAALLEAMRRCREADPVEERERHRRASFLVHRLIRSPLQYRTADLAQALDFLEADPILYHTLLLDESVWPTVKDHIARHGLTSELQACLERCRSTFSKVGYISEIRGLAHRMNELLGNIRPGLMEPGELWAEAALADLDASSQEERDRWQGLIAHALTAKATNPPQRWQAEAALRVGRFDRKIFLGTLAHWFARVKQHPTQLSERNATILKGLVWHCRPLLGADTIKMIGEFASACFVKIPELGPRCAVAGNACVTVIGSDTGQAATEELTRLHEDITYAAPKARVARMLKQRDALVSEAP